MLLVKLALRNLTRHKRRVIAIAIILAIGIAVYLTLDSLMLGLTQMSFDNLINLETGHLQVVKQKYWPEREDLELENLIVWESKLSEKIKNQQTVKAVVPQLKFAAKLNNGIDELPITGYGLDIDQAAQVFQLKKYIVAGSYFTDSNYQAILGKKLADLMELKVGDYLTLLVKTAEETFNTIDAEIVALVNTQNPKVNSNYVYVPLNIAQNALDVDNKISQVIVRLKYEEEVEETIKQLKKQTIMQEKELAVHSWRDSAESVIAMSKAQNIETGFMMGIILIIAAIGIVNTVILSALERTKEIGMMKALGFKKKEIILIFMIEAAGIGVLGGIIGLLLSGVGVYYLTTVGINLSALLGEQTFGLPVIGHLYGIYAPWHFGFIFISGIILSVLASIPPAYWAAKKDPVKAIRS
ncbi:ABC transporter permease [Halanaerobacter jeridensis]|uniref:ABC transport system permease protein n=1 Tax=Halanaerobacter jeridensis TaxID=706427 RepID=A0A938XSC5_9FIRM|nr:FtsX-like permease family protein [Halanaerobacter jeridensis]MBM7555934.1 putative ABC transport system permease protein [Halanaerobacter jeridensis]